MRNQLESLPQIKSLRVKVMNYALPLMGLFVVIAIGVFWTVPKVRAFFETRAEITITENLISQQLEPRRDALQAVDVGRLDASLGTLSQVVPDAPEPVYLMAVLDETARKNVLIFRSPSYEGENADFLTKTTIIRAEIHGTLDDVTRTFNTVVKAIPAMEISSFILEANRAIDLADQFVLRFDLETPFAPLPTQIDGSTETIPNILNAELEVLNEIEQLEQFFVPLDEFRSQDVAKGRSNPFQGISVE